MILSSVIFLKTDKSKKAVISLRSFFCRCVISDSFCSRSSSFFSIISWDKFLCLCQGERKGQFFSTWVVIILSSKARSLIVCSNCCDFERAKSTPLRAGSVTLLKALSLESSE
jgi:hypothetical protein